MKKFMLMMMLLVLNFTLSNLMDHSTLSSRQPASVKKSFLFTYKDLTKKTFQIKKEASTYEEAYKAASRECYQQLTEGRYPGEEKGLDIIDICANPKI